MALFFRLDLFGLQLDERLDERSRFGISGDFLEGFLGKIDPRLALGEAAHVQFHDQSVLVRGSEFAAQDISVGQLELTGPGDTGKQPSQRHHQPN